MSKRGGTDGGDLAGEGPAVGSDGNGAVAAHPGEPGPPWGYVADKEALVKRLRRIEGQARGIERMITEDRYCIDILTQVAAVTTALQAVAEIILDDHVNHCVRHALTSGDEAIAAAKTTELLEAVHRFTRNR
ncbi:MAG: metal-sensitive transcriptional regulator [Actinomycetota bacterium]|nr:metal-sensitive transcriptional regulator [Actinomycetota bacterium]MDA8293477.1 metal-sensitive transcriptional regulator [Actinomycetota bacterium]